MYKIEAHVGGRVSLYPRYSGQSYDLLREEYLLYEFCNLTTPETITIEKTVNVKDNIYNSFGNVAILVYVWKWNTDENKWLIDYQFQKKDEDEKSRNRNQATNTPFFNFLQQHPNMFPLLRQLIGLQR